MNNFTDAESNAGSFTKGDYYFIAANRKSFRLNGSNVLDGINIVIKVINAFGGGFEDGCLPITVWDKYNNLVGEITNGMLVE